MVTAYLLLCSQLKNLGVITFEAHELRKQISAYMMNSSILDALYRIEEEEE